MRAGWLVLVALLGGCQADADTLEQAIDGATIKLESALGHMFGKLRDKRAAVAPSTDGTEADALLEEEFLENQQAALNS